MSLASLIADAAYLFREWRERRRMREELTDQYRDATEDPRMSKTWSEWDFLEEDEE